jgi:hypothetical protein
VEDNKFLLALVLGLVLIIGVVAYSCIDRTLTFKEKAMSMGYVENQNLGSDGHYWTK